MDAKDCEQYSNHPCCDCRNQYAHQLEDKLKQINDIAYDYQMGRATCMQMISKIHTIVEEEVFNEMQ